MQITNGVHRLGNGLVNSYLVEEAGLVTIVDAGMPGNWSDLLAELASMGRLQRVPGFVPAVWQAGDRGANEPFGVAVQLVHRRLDRLLAPP